jgi:hypothetical protein
MHRFFVFLLFVHNLKRIDHVFVYCLVDEFQATESLRKLPLSILRRSLSDVTAAKTNFSSMRSRDILFMANGDSDVYPPEDSMKDIYRQ